MKKIWKEGAWIKTNESLVVVFAWFFMHSSLYFLFFADSF